MRWFKKIKKDFKEFWKAIDSTPEEKAKEYKSFKDIRKEPQRLREFWQRFKARRLTIGDVYNFSFLLAFICWVSLYVIMSHFRESLIILFPKGVLFVILVVSLIFLGILFFAILGLFFREKTPVNIAVAVAGIPLLPTVAIVNYLFYKLTGIGWWVKGFIAREESIEPFLHDPGWYLGIVVGIIVTFITYRSVKNSLEKRKLSSR